ncbi:MAG TPA: VWA domain-containing protein [Blastocatellia bacterium]|nr:VWA domain-containing protein [Blastocatellia bacterium]
MYTRLLAITLLVISVAAQALPQQLHQQAPAQPEPQDEDTIRIGTGAVQMDVIVTDKSGRRINGLTEADFELLDEGVPQPLDFFSAIESSRVTRNRSIRAGDGSEVRVSAARSLLATPFKGRHIALFVDDYNLSNEGLLRAREAIIKYISTELSSNDRVALISTAGALGLSQQFTGDRQALLSSLKRIVARGSIYDRARDGSLRISPAEAVRVDRGDAFVLQTVVERARSEEIGYQVMTQQSIEQIIRDSSRALVAQMASGTLNTLRTLSNLIHGMSELPGRKVVLMLTESLITGGGSTESVTSQVIQTVDQARRAGVSVYALDLAGLTSRVSAEERRPQGLRTNSDSYFSTFENLDAAYGLVVGTGGQLISNTNNLSAGIQDALEDSSTYYVIGFTPTTPPDNKFHKLTVTVKGRPDLVVRTRRGYLSVNHETARGTSTELVSALLSPVPRTELPLEVVANVLPRAGKQVVITGLHVGNRSITLPPSGAPDPGAAYEVIAWVFGWGSDKPVGVLQKTFTFDPVKEADAFNKLKTEGFALVKEFVEFEPGHYQIRAVVREKTTGKVGSGSQFFEVPDIKSKKTPSLSSLVLNPAGEVGFGGHNSFRPGSDVDLQFLLYNPPRDILELVQRVRLINAQGRVLLNANLPAARPQAAGDPAQAVQKTRLKLPAARGRYMLLVNVVGQKGKIDLERRADFVIE